MHAPIEGPVVGIQREPQRLRFRPPEPFGEPIEERAARLRRARLGLDELARRICDQAGLGAPKEPPVGLRGKYYPGTLESPEEPRARLVGRFNLQIPTRRASRLTNYRWHDYGPFHPERPVKPIEIDVPPTTDHGTLPRLLAFHRGLVLKEPPISPHPWLGPVDDRNVRDAKFYEAPWEQYTYRERDDLDVPSEDERPAHKGRWVFVQPGQSEYPPPRWMRILARRAIRHGFPIFVPTPYFALLGTREVGFALKDGYPVSTYVPYRRPKSSSQVAAFIDASVEDEMSHEAYLRLLLSAIEHAAPVKEERDSELSEGEETNRDAWGEYLELLHEVGDGEDEDGSDDLARDMGTRYAWQAPKDLPYSRTLDSDRRREWLTFATRALAPVERIFRRGPPRKTDRKFDPVAEVILRLRGNQLKRSGHQYLQVIVTLAREFKISRARAKRIYDRITRRKNNEPKKTLLPTRGWKDTNHANSA